MASLSASTGLPFFRRNCTRGNGKLGSWHSLSYSFNPSQINGPWKFQLRPFASVSAAGTSVEEHQPRTYAWPDKKQPRVCILGGGFGGLYTALGLESLVWPDDKKPQVVLIDQAERFVFKPMLYELLSGEVNKWEIAPRFSDLLASTSVQFCRDRVKCLYPSDYVGRGGSTVSGSGGVVHLESGMMIEYDWLVLALGAETKLDLVPGAAENALPFSTIEDACKVDERLRMLERENFSKSIPIRVVIVGCGYAGIELAATVSERLEDKGIVKAINAEKTILPNAPGGNREAALKVLLSRNVELLLGYVVRYISEKDQSGVPLDPGKVGASNKVRAAETCRELILELHPVEKDSPSQVLEADLVLWTVGSKSSLPRLESNDKPHNLPLNARGQAETDETLQVKGHPRIFALGDSSAFRDKNGKLLPATAQVAFQQADITAWNLWAAINGRPLLPFRFQGLGEMMVLGRYDAAISPSLLEGVTLEGPIGHAVRKIAYLTRLPTDEHRLKVGFSWLTNSVVDSVAFFQDNIAKALFGS